jgi:hypothetical protein
MLDEGAQSIQTAVLEEEIFVILQYGVQHQLLAFDGVIASHLLAYKCSEDKVDISISHAVSD